MPIAFACPCGKSFSVADAHAGRRTKCPKCAAALTVPPTAATAEDEAFRLLNEAPDPEPPRPVVLLRQPEYTRPPSSRPSPLPPAKKLKRLRSGREERRERPRIVISAGILGGLGAMVVAAVWFIIGWSAGVIYFYPPVMFVFGFVAVVKGLFGHPED